jgi:hypothetical protein
MRIIFLDIDGVLNSQDHMNLLHMMQHRAGEGQSRDEYGHLFDPRCVGWLNYILRMSGEDVKIVISSTWRRSGLVVMQEMWRKRGLPGEVIDITTIDGVDPEIMERYYSPTADRGYEIQQWLEDHSGVTSYVILDDDSDMCPGQLFVHCPGQYGLNRESALKAMEHLNKNTTKLTTDKHE